ncbi:MAG: hypothetical protein K5639_03200 [Eubacterium sp.]|nr:hypothetical protein [Eubacterium sp.]
MSNVVKYPFVNIQGKEARTIAYEDPGEFTPLNRSSKVVIRDAKEVEEEKARGLSVEEIFKMNKPDHDGLLKKREDLEVDGFVPGLNVTIADEILKRHMEGKDFPDVESKETSGAGEEADQIIQDARDQADQIVIDARNQAQDVLEQARNEGIELGREEGLALGAEDTERIRAELEDERRALEQEYEKMVTELEPKFVNIVGGLVTKLTGVVVEDKEDLILHLIKTGLSDVEKPEKIIIRVGQDESVIAEGAKNEFLQEFDEEVSIEIHPQEGLGPGECIIEAGDQMIDAGIHTQLENLMSALKLMV